METDLKSLELRLQQLIALTTQLREENVQLRQDVTRLHQETQLLKRNMTQAGAQIERVLAALPEQEL